MKLLVASGFADRIAATLAKFPDDVVLWPEDEEIREADVRREHAELIVTFGYGYLVKPSVLAVCPALNLHPGYLPWNKGPDPNLWSWLDETPKGVAIHALDAGTDTGPIYCRREVSFPEGVTLREARDRLIDALALLFADSWPAIRAGTLEPRPQNGEGSAHRFSDQRPFSDFLNANRDRPMTKIVAELRQRFPERLAPRTERHG